MGENWMRDLPEYLTNVPLLMLAIPGSHDSGATDELSPYYPIANDEKNNRFLNIVGKSTYVRKIVRRWAITQHSDALAQCLMGVRYFDLRVSRPALNCDLQGFRLIHALYGPTLRKFLEDINIFLREHPKEVIILDINHLFDVDLETHAILQQEIVSVFGEDIIQSRASLSELTLASMWETGKQLLVLTCFEKYYGDLFFRCCDTIDAPYYETNDLQYLIKKMDYCQTHLRPLWIRRFYVTQGICTATMKDIARHPLSSLERQLSLRTSARVIDWLLQYPFPELINIVLIDFITEDYCRDIVGVNYRKHSYPSISIGESKLVKYIETLAACDNSSKSKAEEN